MIQKLDSNQTHAQRCGIHAVLASVFGVETGIWMFERVISILRSETEKTMDRKPTATTLMDPGHSESYPVRVRIGLNPKYPAFSYLSSIAGQDIARILRSRIFCDDLRDFFSRSVKASMKRHRGTVRSVISSLRDARRKQLSREASQQRAAAVGTERTLFDFSLPGWLSWEAWTEGDDKEPTVMPPENCTPDGDTEHTCQGTLSAIEGEDQNGKAEETDPDVDDGEDLMMLMGRDQFSHPLSALNRSPEQEQQELQKLQKEGVIRMDQFFGLQPVEYRRMDFAGWTVFLQVLVLVLMDQHLLSPISWSRHDASLPLLRFRRPTCWAEIRKHCCSGWNQTSRASGSS